MIFLKCINNIDPMSNKLEPINIGQWYVMESIRIGQSFSYVVINGKSYNSIMFEYYDDFMNEVDIYHSKYSPYYHYNK